MGSPNIASGRRPAASGPSSRRPFRAPATRRTVGWLGLFAAAAGVEHGIGEIWQGWRRPEGLMFESWSGVTAFDALGGEPAMSVIPNYVLAGSVSIILAIGLGVWCMTQADRHHFAVVMAGLSVALLLAGGGFGPPLIGLVLASVAPRIGAVPHRWTGPRSLALGRAWRWALAAAAAGFLTLFPGLVLLSPLLPAEAGAIVLTVTAYSFAATAVALVTARAYDRTTPWSRVSTESDCGATTV